MLTNRRQFAFLLILPLLLLIFWTAQASGVVTSWGPNVRANADTGTASQHEPHLAISRTDPDVVVVAAKDYRTANTKEVWIYVSQDGGQTWPAGQQLRIPGLPGDISEQSDPVVVARDDGRIYVAALGYGSGHGLFLTWSDDDGDTWANSRSITHNETPGGLDDKEWLAVDNFPASAYYHNLYVAWANDGILFKRSTDGGESWPAYTTLVPGFVEYPYVVVTADGDVYVFYMDGWGYCQSGTIRFVRSSDGGQSFAPPAGVATAHQPCSPIHGSGGYDQWRFFSIMGVAADPNDPDVLWVAWTDDNNVDYGPTDVRYVLTTDGGTTWSSPQRLSHDPAGTGRDHITPVLAYDNNSRLHAFWLDRRADPANQLFHAYHSSSADLGQSWEGDNQVSQQPFDLNLYFPPPTGYNAAGDYWGLDVSGSTIMAAWNTTVESSQDIYVARGQIGDNQSASLTGRVTDANTGQPLPLAQISAQPGGITATTNASGIYTLTLTAGIYDLTFTASGYLSQTFGNFSLPAGVTTWDVALTPLPEPHWWVYLPLAIAHP